MTRTKMQGKLYAARDDVRTFKVQITANYSGKPISVCTDPPEFELGVTNKSEAFLDKFPLGKVPAFETASGETLVDSDAIAFFLASPEMRGSGEFHQAQVRQFVGLAESEVMPACCNWVYPTLGIMQPNKTNVEKAKETVKQILKLLDQHLASRTFLVGERVSLADICMSCSLLLLYKQVLEPSFRDAYVNTNRWFVTCINQPHFKAVIGEFQLCEKMAQFDSKKFNELNKKEGAGKKGKVPAATPEKKEEKEVPAAEDEPDEDELARQAEPKFVDPYKALPPASLDMDNFKSLYSNEDIEAVALPYLFEKVDLEEHSFWYCDYEYVAELNLAFMANNLISGFYQRIEKLRKTAFAVMCTLEDDNEKALGIRGVWIFRGQEKAFDLCEDWNVDAPSYKFRKLTLEGEDKHLICDYFLRKDELQGIKVHGFKVFK